LSINPTNSIRTYDVVDKYTVAEQPKNVTRLLGNIFSAKEEPQYLLDADFIFVDTAHTGDFEWQVYEYLRTNNYKGFVIFDDIHWCNEMIEFWKKITDTIKYDITSIGHGLGMGPLGAQSGTGLVDFSNQIIIVDN
jgi:hypothetical protein